MNILVAAVSSSRQYVQSLASFYAMKIQGEDLRIIKSGKPGIHSRREVGLLFDSNKEYDALFMADLDMMFPEDTLERLRAHDLDMVTAHYFRRRMDPMLSVCMVDRGGWPYVPLRDVPTEGLHEVATTGLGAVLIKREVFEAVRDALPVGGNPFDVGSLHFLTGDHGHFGADVRFFIIAHSLGYKLWLDASIECSHGFTVWLTNDLYKRLEQKDSHSGIWKELFRQSMEKNGMDAKTAQIRIEQLEMAREKTDSDLTKLQQATERLTLKLAVIDGQLAERELDLQQSVKKPSVMPVLGSREAVEEAIENRGKTPKQFGSHETVEEAVNDPRWIAKRKAEADGVNRVREAVRKNHDSEDAG